jgi:hypothetical protein
MMERTAAVAAIMMASLIGSVATKTLMQKNEGNGFFYTPDFAVRQKDFPDVAFRSWSNINEACLYGNGYCAKATTSSYDGENAPRNLAALFAQYP